MINPVAFWTQAWAHRSGVQLWYADETESTNTFAREDFGEVAKSKLAPILYLAAHQTRGRGRGANTWTDTTGALLSSWSFHMAKPPQPIFAPLAGLAVFNAASKAWPALQWSVKAPNDLFIGSKKVGGLLVESVDRGEERRTVVGLGLNVLSAPENVATSTSLGKELGGEHKVNEADWEKFLQTLVVNFMGTVQSGTKPELSKADAKALADALNKRPNLETKIVNVGPKGELHTASGTIPWQSL